MNFRAKAFAAHLVGSFTVLLIVLGTLYAGWYHWPGWYLVGVLKVAAVMVLVDVGLGPLATLVIANPAKPRTEFRRDLAVIVVIQIAALIYGTATLWAGRPLFYTFSVDRLEVVQASDIDDSEIETARQENPAFAPSWTDLPQWVWVPLPVDEAERARVVEMVLTTGKDVISMPRFYKSWEGGQVELRAQLKPIAELSGFSKDEQAQLQQRMDELGESARLGAILFSGRRAQAVAVFDISTLALKAILEVER